MIIDIVLILLALALFGWYLFGRGTAATAKVDPAQLAIYKPLLASHVAYYQKLHRRDRKRFEQRVAAFIANTRIEGIGTELTDLDRVLIAASAVIPVFGFPQWQYTNLTNVILYPDTFNHEYQFEGSGRQVQGMVGSGYMNGQMLLSRPSLLRGFAANAGTNNTAIHEFVHLLDHTDGAMDGVPDNLVPHEFALPWLQMMHREMHRIKEGKSDIDPYALTNEAEFLAVAAEYFFEKPEKLKQKHPEIYQKLNLIFGQDPAKGGR